jgi:hypothetical protein
VARNHEDKWEERKKKDWKDRLGGLDKRQVQRIPKTIPVEERIFGRLAVPFSFEAVPLVNVFRFWYYLEVVWVGSDLDGGLNGI